VTGRFLDTVMATSLEVQAAGDQSVINSHFFGYFRLPKKLKQAER
jgi:hypothetical protein